MNHALNAILAVGDRMLASLASNDIDAFSDAVRERDRLIRAFADEGPADDADVERAARALTDQHARLETEMNRMRAVLGSELGAFARYRSARQAYRRPGGPQKAILNKCLHG